MIDISRPHYDVIKGLLAELYTLPNTNSSVRRREIYGELAKYSISPGEAMDIREEVIAKMKEKSSKELKDALNDALALRKNGSKLETSSQTA